MGDEFNEHVKREATTRWKWKNPIVAALLAFALGPLGFVYFSWKKAIVGLVLVFASAEFFRFVGWWPLPLWARLGATLPFAVYAYLDTRWTNAAIEYYKYGLPGTGTQRPEAVLEGGTSVHFIRRLFGIVASIVAFALALVVLGLPLDYIRLPRLIENVLYVPIGLLSLWIAWTVWSFIGTRRG